MESKPGSRQQALNECQQAGPGTVGSVIASILTMPIISLTVRYEIASGDIGQFYQRPDIKAILRSPSTDANLRELATRETLFFRTQTGSAGAAGQLLDEEQRVWLLKRARDW